MKVAVTFQPFQYSLGELPLGVQRVSLRTPVASN